MNDTMAIFYVKSHRGTRSSTLCRKIKPIISWAQPDWHFNGLYSSNLDRLIVFLYANTKEWSSRVQTFKRILFLGVNLEVDLFLFLHRQPQAGEVLQPGVITARPLEWMP